MPLDFKVESIFPGCNSQLYFLERDGYAFRELAMKALKLRKMEFLNTQPLPDGVVLARLATRPDFGRYMPAKWVDWLTGDQLEFVDEIQYKPELLQGPKYTLVVKCVLPWLSRKADINCRLSFEQRGSDTIQTLEGRVHIKLPGVGRIAEPMIVNGLRQAYADLPKLLTEWEHHRETILSSGSPSDLLQGRPTDLPGPLEGTIHAATASTVNTANTTVDTANAVNTADGSVPSEYGSAGTDVGSSTSADTAPSPAGDAEATIAPTANPGDTANPVAHRSSCSVQPATMACAESAGVASEGVVQQGNVGRMGMLDGNSKKQGNVQACAVCADGSEKGLQEGHSGGICIGHTCRADSVEHDALAAVPEQPALAS